jgi:hypothetical protein
MAQIIKADQVTTLPRGRKAEYRDDLLALFGKLKPGQAVVLDEEFDPAPGDEGKAARQKVGQTIRKHWDHARQDSCKINFTAEGVAQVRVKEEAKA